MREVGEAGNATHGRRRYRSLQRSTAAVPCGGYDRAVVTADQIAKGIFDSHFGLLCKYDPGRRAGRRLGFDRQMVRRRDAYGDGARSRTGQAATSEGDGNISGDIMR